MKAAGYLLLLLCSVFGGAACEEDEAERKPHIIMIIADDMGWNDVSFHGSDQIPTPNIDALAYNGVILNSHYVGALCTPSRSALLSGKLPIHTGMQHSAILEAEPRGLPLREKILPQYLKDAGYATHAVGKWHQGFYRREYTPTYRGFDSHFGYWQGLQDYYSHEVHSSHAEEGFRGFDMRRNMSVARDTRGHYSTDLFSDEAVRLIEQHPRDRGMFLYLAHLAPHSGNAHEPLQAPDHEVAKFAYIRDPERRIYAAMMSKLDESVGRVVQALRSNGMLDNSIVIFMADNGAATQGMHYNRGSNYPLRGIKASAWEGAVRGAAAVWSPLIARPKRVHNQLMFIGDWLPTLLSAAKIPAAAELAERKVDGLDMWASISGEAHEAMGRDELLINIDSIYDYAAMRRGAFKYVLGSVGNGEEWYGDTGRPENAHLEGSNPTYDPQLVLSSAAATAISGLLTARQAREVRRSRRHGDTGRPSSSSSAQLLSAQELMKLRSEAVIRCTVADNETVACDPKQSACLFDIEQDPCEQRNLAASRPELLASLEQALSKYRLTALPPSNVPNDPNANPELWKDTWVCWRDEDPLESLIDYQDQVSKNKMQQPAAQLIPGPSSLAVIALLLALAVLGIFVLVALRCTHRQRQLSSKQRKAKPHRHRDGQFQELAQTELKAQSDSRAPSKALQNFTNELRNMPSVKDLARSIE